MAKLYIAKSAGIEAMQVTEDNLEEVAAWCHGGVAGTSLPKAQRCVKFYHQGYGDLEANVGDWITIDPATKTRLVYTSEEFTETFKEKE